MGRDEINALIDCGATITCRIQQLAIDRNAINTIFHNQFPHAVVVGICVFILEADSVLKRQSPLTIAGPPSLNSRYAEMMESASSGTSALRLFFR